MMSQHGTESDITTIIILFMLLTIDKKGKKINKKLVKKY